MTTIRDLLQRGKKKRETEDKELQLALELSAKEQVNEQQRLLEQFSNYSQPVRKRKRMIKRDKEGEEDEWFQTISTRPQNKVKKVKQESEPFQFDMDSIFQAEEAETQMISDSDSSIIDLVNVSESAEEEEDGYLSPLEGFKSLKEDDNPSFLAQLQTEPKQKRGRATSTKKGYKRRNKWARKRKR